MSKGRPAARGTAVRPDVKPLVRTPNEQTAPTRFGWTRPSHVRGRLERPELRRCSFKVEFELIMRCLLRVDHLVECALGHCICLEFWT